MRHAPNRFQQFGKRRLNAAEPGRQQQSKQVRLLELAHRGRGQPAQPLGLLGALGQPRDEFVGDPVQWAAIDHGHGVDRNILFSMVTAPLPKPLKQNESQPRS